MARETLTLKRAESIVDWGYAPASPRTEAAKAYARLDDLRTLGPEGELDDCFCNRPIAAFVAAARLSGLSALTRKLEALERRVPGRTFAARREQLRAARAAVTAIETWTTNNADKLTMALARIALDAGWVKQDARARAKREDKEGWSLVKKVKLERKAGATYFLDDNGDVSMLEPRPGGARRVRVARLGVVRRDGWTYTLFDDGVYRTEAAWVVHR